MGRSCGPLPECSCPDDGANQGGTSVRGELVHDPTMPERSGIVKWRLLVHEEANEKPDRKHHEKRPIENGLNDVPLSNPRGRVLSHGLVRVAHGYLPQRALAAFSASVRRSAG